MSEPIDRQELFFLSDSDPSVYGHGKGSSRTPCLHAHRSRASLPATSRGLVERRPESQRSFCLVHDRPLRLAISCHFSLPNSLTWALALAPLSSLSHGMPLPLTGRGDNVLKKPDVMSLGHRANLGTSFNVCIIHICSGK